MYKGQDRARGRALPLPPSHAASGVAAKARPTPTKAPPQPTYLGQSDALAPPASGASAAGWEAAEAQARFPVVSIAHPMPESRPQQAPLPGPSVPASVPVALAARGAAQAAPVQGSGDES